ncbi:hypothetical protein HHK36_018478 [Tetracentron sinense]|uniref:Uncharacterized protein n=1 Tax=Tetracentron sinense TaxID=13715 RepID=A0A835DAD1_TETSI|nr:hypothetical protein HHK36_018478 [Tetracentron sinense]
MVGIEGFEGFVDMGSDQNGGWLIDYMDDVQSTEFIWPPQIITDQTVSSASYDMDVSQPGKICAENSSLKKSIESLCPIVLALEYSSSLNFSTLVLWERDPLQTLLHDYLLLVACYYLLELEWNLLLHQGPKLAVRRYDGTGLMIGMITFALCMNAAMDMFQFLKLSGIASSIFRFLELCSIMEPGRPLKTDKVAILSDATRLMNQLRVEAGKLKETNEALQDTIKSLKAEKMELRDEKVKLKAEKERMEQAVKSMSIPSPFVPHPTFHVAANGKTIPYHPNYMPPMAMWQWMPPASLDTSQDHVLRPPVA